MGGWYLFPCSPYIPCSQMFPFFLKFGPLLLCYPEMNALFPLFPNPWEGFSDEPLSSPPPPPGPRITQMLNGHEKSIPKHIWFHFQNRLCVSYNVVAVPIIKSDPGFFLPFLGTWHNPQNWKFSRCFIQIWEKLTPYIIIKLNKKKILIRTFLTL